MRVYNTLEVTMQVDYLLNLSTCADYVRIVNTRVDYA